MSMKPVPPPRQHGAPAKSVRRPLPAVVRKPNLSDGVARVLEAGALPADVDLERLLTTDGPFRARRALVHPFADKRSARVMTEVSPYSRMNGVTLDVTELSKIPAKLNLKELHDWERAQRRSVDASSVTNPSTSAVSFPARETTREDTRTYAELLDLYSMHEFIIRKGATLRSTPEFASFKRRYAACWGNVQLVIRRLEEFLSNFGIDIAFVDGKQVAALAAYQVDDALSREDILRCFANSDELEPLTRSVAQQYAHGTKGHDLAAQKIQATWRMYFQRIAYRHLLVGTRAAIVLQRKWALNRAHFTTQKTIKAIRDTRLLRWKKTMEEFVRSWPTIKTSRRTIIHLPSLSYPRFHARRVPFYFAQQMGQITRVADLRDPNVDVVLISPFRPEPEVIEYYQTLLEDSGVVNVRGRLVVLVPEDSRRLPEHLSLTRLVLLSSRLMKCLESLCKGRHAYVVPGVIGPEELSFATELNVPMLSAEPTIAQAFGTKSGCQRLLSLAEINTPFGAYNLRNRSELVRSMAALMIEHREVTRWIVKLETESCSRGHAYFDVNRIRVLRAEDEELKTYENVLAELEDHAGKRARLVHPYSYPDWDTYMDTFDLVGGCVEAVPNRIQAALSANLFIEPTGTISLHSVVEPMLAPAYTIMGCRFPLQKLVPYGAIRDAAMNAGRAAFRKRIMGYISVDFILFETSSTTAYAAPSGGGASCVGNSEESVLRLCAVDVDLCLTNNAAAHNFACLVTDSKWDAATGTCTITTSRQQLSYAYSGLIYSPSISAVRHAPFFALCRSKGLSFDREKRAGLVFHMVDVLLRCCIGVLSVGTHRASVTRVMKAFQALLNLELPKQSEHSAESNFVYFSSAIHQLTRSVSISKEGKSM